MTHYDVLVIGSGFGGSVSALRLTEKGYTVGVLEAGARFEDGDFPKTSFDARRWLFAPAAGMYGIQRIDMVKDCLILAGAGVGGGSLVYANTLYEPLDAFYRDPSWARITDWKSELAPYYDQAKRMLGVVQNPLHTPSDEVMRQVAEDMNVGHTFRHTPVGVFFGGPDATAGEEVADPFFGGAGPARNACLNCGECMTGCRHNAKNTLVKNYLHLAEQAGAVVHPLTTVTRVRPRDGGGYEVTARWTKAKLSRRTAVATFTADQVIFSAAALGTQKLLHQLKGEGHLPHVSDRLGVLTRTNSEAILGAVAGDRSVDYTRGVAITSSFHPDEVTHVEPVRYGRGSNAMALLQTVLADDVPGTSRVRTWLRELWAQRRHAKDLYDLRHWSERAVIALVMQSLDNSITTVGVKGRLGWRMSSKQGHGAPNPTYIPVAYDAVRRVADLVDGTPGGTIGEPFNRPMTAHFIGGCTIGDSPQTGVVDPWQRLYGHDGLHVVDGSAISANLGVNPSLTITAQAERAMAFWPNKGEADPRPALGSAYRRLAPVEPKNPAVPEAAPGALRLPIVGVS
ncbi:GMC family oxidoreductase [Microvirga sp. 0TCS3.31]